MIRYWCFVLLLLAAGLVLADEVPETEPVPGSAEEQAQTEEGAESLATAAEAQASTEQGARSEASGAEAQARAEQEAEPGAGAAEAKAQTEDDEKLISGMSVLGNREAPKSLVIVPWKSSEIGDSIGISTMLDDSRRPVDREVFMRELSYYEIQHGGRGSAVDADETQGRK